MSDLRFALPAKKLALLGVPLVSELHKKAQTFAPPAPCSWNVTIGESRVQIILNEPITGLVLMQMCGKLRIDAHGRVK